MINKKFHHLLKGVSVLPALLVAPAMAGPGIGFVDGYVTEFATQLHDVLEAQNANGFQIGSISVGIVAPVNTDNSLRYGIANRGDAEQYVEMTDVSLPTGFGEMCLTMPLYNAKTGYGLRANAPTGLGELKVNEFDKIESILGPGVVNRDANGAVTSVTPHVSDAVSLLNTAIGMNILHGRTWFLGAVNDALDTGKVGEGYLYTDNNFVIDGNYGKMAGNLIDTYRTSLESILDELAPNLENMTTQEIADAMTRKLGKMALDAGGVDYDLGDAFVKATGRLIFRDAFGIEAEKVAEKWQSGELKSALSSYLTQIKDELSGLDSLKLNAGTITVDDGSVTFQNTVDLTAGSVAINGGTVTVDSGAELTVAGNTFKNDAALVNKGTLTFNENVTGTGALTVVSGSTLNIGTNNIQQGTIVLNGTMNATVREGDTAQISVGNFGGSGNLNLIIADAGTYHIFDGAVLDSTQVKNSVYKLSWTDGNVTASLKSADGIAKDNGITQDAASAVAGLTASTSAALNDMAMVVQEKLTSGSVEEKRQVEEATAALNPESASVVQSAATSVQTTVTNLAASRMSAPTAGRSGGDVNLTGGGVWAQGLYNKSKMNDQFNGYTRGVALGADGTIDKDVTVGMGYSFNHSDIASNSRNTEIDSNTVFLYGQYKPAEWYVNAVMNYTWSDYSDKGYVLGTPKTADYDIGSFGMAVAGGYDFDTGITPELGLRYIHVGSDTYTDSLGIKNKIDSTNYLTATLGTRYGFDITNVKNVLFRPEVRYAVKYDLVSDESSAIVTMPGVNSYTLTGDRLPRVGNELGIGLTVKYRTMDLSLSYDIDVREDYTSQTGMLKFRYEF